MRNLFSTEGLFALQNLASVPSVLVFDLDGTLAPLVPHFADAKVPLRMTGQLMSLSRLWPIAVVTGRSVKDAQGRLGFTPDYLFGNHGAERAGQPALASFSDGLDAFRRFVHPHLKAMTAQKIILEDKEMSLALHYRQADNPASTCAWLHALITTGPADVVVTHGHNVINILQLHAPDKGHALQRIMQDSQAVCALVVGDDDNDESAFAMAPELAVTVRIGAATTKSCARFRLNYQHQVERLLDALLEKTELVTMLPECK